MNKLKSILGTTVITLLLASCNSGSSESGARSTGSDTGSSPNSDRYGQSIQDSQGDSPDQSAMRKPVQKMIDAVKKIEGKGNIDLDLATLLLAHQKGGIDLAMAEQHYGTSPKLKELAAGIQKPLENRMAALEAIVKKYEKGPVNYGSPDVLDGPGKAVAAIVASLKANPDDLKTAVDDEFIVFARKHLNDGLKIADAVVTYAKDPDLKLMGKEIEDQYSRALKQLKEE